MDIIIDTCTFKEEDKDAIRISIDKLIREQLPQNLNLSLLRAIIIPEDFTTAIISFQEEHGSIERGHTDNEFGKAMLKTLHYKENGVRNEVIFISKEIIHALYMEEYQQQMIRYIHHELCHVHDDYNKSIIYNENERLGYNVEHILKVHADGVWSEYIANRLSSTSIPIDSDLDIPFLMDLISGIKEKAESQINYYRFHDNIDRLFGEIQDESSLLLKGSAYVIGNLHGLELYKSKNKIYDMIEAALSDNYFYDIWQSLDNELQNLYNLYPDNWSGINQLNNLSTIVLSLWNKLGIYPMTTASGIYIDVPIV